MVVYSSKRTVREDKCLYIIKYKHSVVYCLYKIIITLHFGVLLSLRAQLAVKIRQKTHDNVKS